MRRFLAFWEYNEAYRRYPSLVPVHFFAFRDQHTRYRPVRMGFLCSFLRMLLCAQDSCPSCLHPCALFLHSAVHAHIQPFTHYKFSKQQKTAPFQSGSFQYDRPYKLTSQTERYRVIAFGSKITPKQYYTSAACRLTFTEPPRTYWAPTSLKPMASWNSRDGPL